MKKGSLKGKLSLGKETISKLGLSKVAGGGIPYTWLCDLSKGCTETCPSRVTACTGVFSGCPVC
jgi:hypothetical protein